MKIILVAGGSGGHIYPCIEMGKYFIERGDDVLICGSNNSIEEKIAKKNGLKFKGININKNYITNFLKNYKNIKQIYSDYTPEALLLFGNYISVSFGIVAIFKKIPIYLHEQNVIYGDANRLLGYKAKKIYLSLPINKDVHERKSVLVGNPRCDVVVRKKYLMGKYNVLITMGSLGSSSVNKILLEFIKISNIKVNYHIVVGEKYYDEFINKSVRNPNVKIYSYIDDLNSYIKECDLVVSRSGATTISEILVNSAASILIPSPYVKHNHQYLNAKYLLDNEATIVINEIDLSAKLLNEKINELLEDYSLRLKLKINSRKLSIVDSKRKIYEDIKNNDR